MFHPDSEAFDARAANEDASEFDREFLRRWRALMPLAQPTVKATCPRCGFSGDCRIVDSFIVPGRLNVLCPRCDFSWQRIKRTPGGGEVGPEGTMTHLPNYYNDEDWNDLTDAQRERASRAFQHAQLLDVDELNEQIQALYDEANEYEANAEGTSDLVTASALRREAEQLIELQRDMRKQED